MFCDTTISVLMESSGCDLFRMVYLTKQSVHYSLAPLWKCNNLRNRWSSVNFQISGRQTAATRSIQLTTKSGAYFSNESTRHMCRMWMTWCSVWLICGLD